MVRTIKSSKLAKTVLALILTLSLFLLFGGVSHAATSTATAASVQVGGGNLSIAAVNPTVDFGTVTLSGSAQTVNKTVGDVNETDLTGTGAGWHVTVKASQFASGSYSLPVGSLQLAAPTAITKTGGTTSAAPVTQTGAPWVIDTASAVPVLSAATGTGMGTYTSTFGGNLSLTVPANAYAGTYSSTLDWQIITAP